MVSQIKKYDVICPRCKKLLRDEHSLLTHLKLHRKRPDPIKNSDWVHSPKRVKGISMTFDEYQVQAQSTVQYPEKYKIIYPALKLAGEAGEFAEKVGKVIRDKNEEFFENETRNALALELGDVLWYIQAAANDIGFSLQHIAEMNIEKLKSRRERGVIKGEGDNR